MLPRVTRAATEPVRRALAAAAQALLAAHVRGSQRAVQGVALGNLTPTPALAQVLVLLPLPAVMAMLGSMLAAAIHAVVEAQPPVPAMFEAARPGTTPTHDVMALRSAIEKGVDSRASFRPVRCTPDL